MVGLIGQGCLSVAQEHKESLVKVAVGSASGGPIGARCGYEGSLGAGLAFAGEPAVVGAAAKAKVMVVSR